MEKELAEHLYRTMVRIRHFEEAVQKWFYQGKVPGFVHLYLGEEAIATGVCAALRDDDRIASTHRGHGHVLAKGGDTKRMMAEIFGRVTGLCTGKGGSMHLADYELGILGTNGILAGGVPMATGIGLGSKMRESDQLGVVFIGDAAANQGVVWESLNIAGLWKLPVIYVIENNGFSEWMPTEELTSSVDFARRATNWGGVEAEQIDGNDVMAVYEAAKAAVRRARAGEGPTLLDCRTYRWRGHTEGEEAMIGKWAYRTEEEFEEWKARDPVQRFQARLLESGVLSPQDMEAIDAEAEAEIELAIEYAEESPWPEPEEALEGVFSN